MISLTLSLGGRRGVVLILRLRWESRILRGWWSYTRISDVALHSRIRIVCLLGRWCVVVV